MKRHASLALAPLSILLLLFGIAATPASAVETTLCQKAEENCKNQYPTNQVLEANVVTWELENSFGPVTCAQSTLKGKTTAKAGEPLPGEITAQDLAKCSIDVGGKVTNCGVATAVNLPYAASLGWKAFSMSGQWRWKSSGAGNPGFKLECGAVMNCTYTATEPVAELFGGNPASVAVKKVAMARAGTVCPTSSNWSALWAFTKPVPLYVGWV
ncbi:MAG: hypothetical protein QOE56_885 [Solirubrobacterales bacterium]|jgi:hypothetical protein|nr:hypothetical protein [Solirubrobacterales bacterium]